MKDVFYPILEFQNLISKDISDENNVYKLIHKNRPIEEIKDKIVKLTAFNKSTEVKKNYRFEIIKSDDKDSIMYSDTNKYIIVRSLNRDFALICDDIRIPNLINNLDYYRKINKIRFMSLKNVDKNIIAACILAFGLIISSFVFAYSNRYEIVRTPESGMFRVDKWNGTIGRLEPKK